VDLRVVTTNVRNVQAITGNVIIVSPYASGNHVPTDANGDIAVTVTSNLLTTANLI